MNRAGFTLLESLACLLILSLAIAAGVGMTAYGLAKSAVAQARATAMSTAISLTYDQDPLMPPGTVWPQKTGPGGAMEGWVNGYYVIRREESPPTTISTGIESVVVHVDVFDGINGGMVASASNRVVRSRAP